MPPHSTRKKYDGTATLAPATIEGSQLHGVLLTVPAPAPHSALPARSVYDVKVPEGSDRGSQVRFEEFRDSRRGRGRIPGEDARVFTPIEPHGQGENRIVRGMH